CRGLGFESAEGVCPIWEVAPDGRRTLVTDGAWHEDLGAFVAAFVRDGTHVTRLLGQGDVNGAGWSSDGATVATSNQDSVVVWDVTATGGGESLSVAGAGGFDFSRGGRFLAVGADTGHVDLYETRDGRRVLDFRPHTQNVDVVALDARGSRLATASSDGSVKLSDAQS